MRTLALIAIVAATGCTHSTVATPGGPSTSTPGVQLDAAGSTLAVDRASTTADGHSRIKVTVTMRDMSGRPAVGQTVALAATGSPRTLLQPGSPTDSNGIAIGWLSSPRAGTSMISASASGMPVAQPRAVQFMPGPAAQLHFQVPPSTVSAGAAMTVAVSLLDSNGNATAAALPVTLTLVAPAGTTATLSGKTSQPAVSGLARFSDLAVDVAASGYQLRATAPGLPALTSPLFDVVAGAAARLAFVTGPRDTVAGATLKPLQVAVEDAAGNVIPDATDAVTIALADSDTALGGTLTVNAVAGLATFSDVTIAKSGSYRLAAFATGHASVTSAPFTISAGAAALVRVTSQPKSAAPGAPFTISVALYDADGNPASDDATVSLSLDGARGTLAGATVLDTTGGSVSFAGLDITTAGSYTVDASAPGLAAGVSAPIAIVANTPAQLVVVAAPGTSTAGAPLAPALQIGLADAYGNLVSAASDDITVSLGSNSAGGTLAGTRLVATVDGVATFSDLSLARAGGSYTLVATSTSYGSVSTAPFAVVPAAGTQLRFVQQPSETTSATHMAPAVTVQVTDDLGNPVSASATVTLAVASGPQGNTLGGTHTVTAVGGLATFANLTLDKAGSYTLSARADGLHGATSASFIIDVGPAAAVAFSSVPSGATAGATFTVVATLVDAGGNLTDANLPVTLALHDNPSAGTLNGTLTRTAVAGVARFDDVWIDRSGDGYSVIATASDLTVAISGHFAISPDVASVLAVSAPARAFAGTPFTVQVSETDRFGNVVTTASDALTLSAAGPGALGGTTTRSASEGRAGFSGLTLGVTGSYVLTAQGGGLTSSGVNLTVETGAPAGLAILAQPASGEVGATLSAVRVALVDGGGNIVGDDNVQITVAIGNNPGGAALSGTLAGNAGGGTVSFADLSLNSGGNGYTLVFSAAGVPSLETTAFDVIQPQRR